MKKKIMLSLYLMFTTLNANNVNNPAQYTVYTNMYTQNKQDLLTTFKLHHKSAVKGNTIAQYQLALMFHYGSGVRQNEELARLWFKRASKKGHPQAQSILYRCYSTKRLQSVPIQRARYSMNFRR